MARHTPGNYVPLDVNYPREGSIRRAGEHAELLFIRGLAYCKGARSGGFIPDYDLEVVAIGLKRVPQRVAALIREGLWIDVDGGWFVPSWGKWNGGSDAFTRERSATGLRGNHVRWHVNGGKPDPDCEWCSNSRSDSPTVLLSESLSDRKANRKGREGKGSRRTPSSAAADGPFDEFWQHYPRKVGKDDARRVFRRRIKDTDAAVVIAGAKRLAADPNLPEKQFIPHPATWLQRGGWDDEPLPAPAAGGGRPEPERPGFWNEAIA